MTKQQCIASRNDQAFILHPDWWPLFGVLPVRRPCPAEVPPEFSTNPTWVVSVGLGHQCGVIVATDLTAVRVGVLGVTNFSHASTPVIKYNSVEELVADGWRVD